MNKNQANCILIANSSTIKSFSLRNSICTSHQLIYGTYQLSMPEMFPSNFLSSVSHTYIPCTANFDGYFENSCWKILDAHKRYRILHSRNIYCILEKLLNKYYIEHFQPFEKHFMPEFRGKFQKKKNADRIFSRCSLSQVNLPIRWIKVSFDFLNAAKIRSFFFAYL